MAQHFLLSSAAKTLTLGSVLRMSDSEVERVFVRLRWQDNDGEPYCPHCGCRTVYEGRRNGNLRWQCKACPKGFSHHVRHPLCLAQDADPFLPHGYRDLLQ